MNEMGRGVGVVAVVSGSSLSAITSEKIEEDLWDIMDH